jgi:CheY-like chemotaxis protein
MPDLPLTVLLVDDDDVAVESVIRSLRKHNVLWPILVAEDGSIALEILRGQHDHIKIAQPYVILLDLNMPRMNGFEFLQAARTDPLLRETIVFILTTSSSDTDRARAYQECIAGYMVKSAVGPQFSKLARMLIEFRAAVSFPRGVA